MVLSNDLISQFVKITKDDNKDKTETTVYGTIVESNGTKYVRFDGADENQLTPVTMTVDAEDGERVSILLKDHTATVNGNISSPAVRTETVKDVTELLADKASIKQLEVESGRIDDLEASNVTVNETLTAHNADIKQLKSDIINTGNLEAINAKIENLETDKLSAADAKVNYANIDFANIGEAAIEKLFTDSGIIIDLVMSEGHVTGKLVGVTIIGDLIEGGTVKADKLVILGTDGLYYKLNTNGVTTTAEQTDYNSLNGKIITAKSITAEKVNVDDLVAFGATIGGFHITESSIYSGAKASVDNTTRGIYQDTDGQFVIGDASNFLKFYKDTDGTYKLAISANSITFGDSGKSVEEAIDEIEVGGRNLVLSSNDISNYWVGSQAIISQDGDVIKGLTNTTDSNSWPRIWNTSVSRLLFDTTSKYTLSFDVRVDSDRTVSIGIMEPGGREQIIGTAISATTEWAKITYTFTPLRETSQYAYNLQFYTYYSGKASTTAWIEIKNIKLEKGNKATDWTPAPEDIDTAIEGIKAVTITGVDVLYALSASSTIAPTSDWSTTAPEWSDGEYMWQKTVTTYGDGSTSESAVTCLSGAQGQNGNGVISVTELYFAKADAIVPSAPTSTITTNSTTAYGVWNKTQPSYNSAYPHYFICSEIKFTDNTYNWSEPIYAGALTSANQTATNASNTVKNLDIGGRNLIVYSEIKSHAGSITANANADMDNETQCGLISGENTAWYLRLLPVSKLTPGGTYTVSVRTIVNDSADFPNSAHFKLYDFTNQTTFGAVTLSDGGTFTFTVPEETEIDITNTEAIIYVSYATAVNFTVTGLKLEKGNKATDWSPAPEDVQGAIREAVNKVEIGGANMLQYTDTSKYGTEYWTAWGSATIDVTSDNYVKVTNTNAAATFGAYGATKSANVIAGREYTVSFDGYADSEMNLSYCYLMGIDENSSLYGLGISPTLSTESKKISFTFTATSDKTCSVMLAASNAAEYTGSFYFKNLKLEEGNKATSWTPAPEDVQTDIDNALDNALVAVDDNATKIEYLDGLVEKIIGALSTLVTDDNGTTLLQQTGTGWSFNFSDIRNALDKYDSYIKLDESSDQPCIILGKTTSNFKVKITNTDIEFIEGSGNPVAKITSNDDTGESLIEIEKAKINGDLQQDNWVWQTRSNGNYGLIWKG